MCHFLRLWFPSLTINWTIIESPAIVRAYKTFKIESNITWLDKLPDSNFDVAITSCTLQYLVEPNYSLQELMNCASTLIVLRFPELKNSLTKFAVQKIPRTNNFGEKSWAIRFFGKG